MNEIKRFIKEEDGMGTLEIVIIIAVLLSLALLFRKQLGELWKNASEGLNQHKDQLKNLDLEGST